MVLTACTTIVVLLVMIENSLLKAIQICNGQTALAEKIGKGQTLISSWVKRRECRVGADYVIEVAAATDWQVTPHELRPDLYPHPKDGLPEHLRYAA